MPERRTRTVRAARRSSSPTVRIRRPPACAPMMMNTPVGNCHHPFCCGREEPRALQEHREHEAEAELPHREHESGEEPVAVRLDLQVREREQRMRVAALLGPLDEIEPDEDRDRDHEHDRHDRDRPRRGPHAVPDDGEVLQRLPPAVGAALAQREHEQEHARPRSTPRPTASSGMPAFGRARRAS